MIAGYITWWYLYDYVETNSHSLNPITEVVIYINVALILVYCVVYFRFVASYCNNKRKKKKSHHHPHSSKRSHSRSSRSKDDSPSRPLSPRSSQSSRSSSSSSSRSKSKRRRNKESLKLSKLYRKCVPILLLDNEICTIYFAACIYEYIFEEYSHSMQYIPISICCSCLILQWISLCVGYYIVKFLFLCLFWIFSNSVLWIVLNL